MAVYWQQSWYNSDESISQQFQLIRHNVDSSCCIWRKHRSQTVGTYMFGSQGNNSFSWLSWGTTAKNLQSRRLRRWISHLQTMLPIPRYVLKMSFCALNAPSDTDGRNAGLSQGAFLIPTPEKPFDTESWKYWHGFRCIETTALLRFQVMMRNSSCCERAGPSWLSSPPSRWTLFRSDTCLSHWKVS